MSEIRKRPEAIGLSQYGDAFEANNIDMDSLGQLDDQILKDIGVSAARKRLRASPRATTSLSIGATSARRWRGI
jgi:hypothetical protein